MEWEKILEFTLPEKILGHFRRATGIKMFERASILPKSFSEALQEILGSSLANLLSGIREIIFKLSHS